MTSLAQKFLTKLKTLPTLSSPKSHAPHPSANVAKERLQLILAHQRGSVVLSNVNVALLQEELLSVIQKHIKVARDADINLQVKHQHNLDIFEMQVPVEKQTSH